MCLLEFFFPNEKKITKHQIFVLLAFCEGIHTGHRWWFPITKGQFCGKLSGHCRDIMIPSVLTELMAAFPVYNTRVAVFVDWCISSPSVLTQLVIIMTGLAVWWALPRVQCWDLGLCVTARNADGEKGGRIREVAAFFIHIADGEKMEGHDLSVLPAWLCHDMEKRSTLLALCEGNPSV